MTYIAVTDKESFRHEDEEADSAIHGKRKSKATKSGENPSHNIDRNLVIRLLVAERLYKTILCDLTCKCSEESGT